MIDADHARRDCIAPRFSRDRDLSGVLEVDPIEPITLPRRDLRRRPAVLRSVVQFRVTPEARGKADSLLARLQSIAPEAKLTLTDLMTAAMTQYITAFEDQLARLPEAQLRGMLMAAYHSIESERLRARNQRDQERLAKNV